MADPISALSRTEPTAGLDAILDGLRPFLDEPPDKEHYADENHEVNDSTNDLESEEEYRPESDQEDAYPDECVHECLTVNV